MEKYKLEQVTNRIIEEAVVKEIMSLDLAVKLIGVVEKKAEEMGLRIVAAVSDAGGGPLYGRSLSRKL